MKAALLVAPGRVIVDEIPDPDPGPGEVRIAVGGVGLCGSDLSVFSGRWRAPSTPWVMGHEAFGTIDAVGEGVAADRVGQQVVVEPNITCGACDACRRGWSSACLHRQSIGMNRQGALAERLVLPERFAWPASGSPPDLVCVEPATVVRAALRRAGFIAPEVFVVGAGAQGLLMTQALLERGARVTITDTNAARVRFARHIGAELDSDPDARFGLVVDTVGSPRSLEAAFQRLEIGGMILVLGLDDRPWGLTAQMLVRRQARLLGSLTYDHPADFEATLGLMEQGKLSPGTVITEEFELNDVQAAFDRCSTAPGKTWIRIGGQHGNS
ncbi:MAG TPA: alcohol dehydrogenase catalytic domain-containing protein [Candidatus Tectomicrobia bacterium]|nr:alcohol dehydrogenase catalytic domain-containing protein [Candidatus Tectomicrobia bacterium]